MKWTTCIPLTLALAASAPQARAQVPPPEQNKKVKDKSTEMWRDFQLKLTKIARAGREGNNTLVAFMNPGLMLPTDMKADTRGYTFVYGLLDRVIEPDPTLTWHPNGTGYWRTFRDTIVKNIQFDKTPIPGPEKAEYEEARKYLQDGTSQMEAYRKYQKDFDDAEEALANAQADNITRGQEPDYNTGRLVRARDDAENNWIVSGNRGEVEEKQLVVSQYFAKDPNTALKALQDDCNKGEYMTVRGLGIVRCLPNIDDWEGDKGWITFTYKSSDSYRKESFESTEWDTAAKIQIGAFTGEGSAAYSNQIAEEMAKKKDVTMSMQIKVVFFYRSWFRRDVLMGKNYVLKNNGVISYGPTPPSGKRDALCPVDTFGLILARNVEFTSNAFKTHQKELQESLRASAKASYGPFSISGNYSEESRSKEMSEHLKEGKFLIPDAQIIAIIGDIVPPCPPKKFTK